MSIVNVDGVSKSYSKNKVLDGISLSIEKGEIVGLIGPSGAGKSTLVKAMVGMEKVDCGVVKIFDTKMPNREVLQNIGYMAQADALYEDLSGRENLVFFAKLFGVSRADIDVRVNHVASLVNIGEHLSKKVRAYSGGMKRRLSLAIALIQDPKLLILDEPTVGIDPKLRVGIWQELNVLKAQGKSIIVTTHVMDEAEKCDRLALIRDGKIIISGSPSELKKELNVSSIEEIFLIVGGK